MEEPKDPEDPSRITFKDMLLRRRPDDVSVFKINRNDWWIVKALKYAINYTMYGFVMFMTFIVLTITLVAC